MALKTLFFPQSWHAFPAVWQGREGESTKLDPWPCAELNNQAKSVYGSLSVIHTIGERKDLYVVLCRQDDFLPRPFFYQLLKPYWLILLVEEVKKDANSNLLPSSVLSTCRDTIVEFSGPLKCELIWRLCLQNIGVPGAWKSIRNSSGPRHPHSVSQYCG